LNEHGYCDWYKHRVHTPDKHHVWIGDLVT